DGFQLCRALRCDERWARLPFIFYSSIFIGDRAQELGMDLGATAYLDAKHVPPEQIAKEIDALVNRVVGTEYRETLVQLRDELEFARRYHQVVLSSLGAGGHAGVRDTISSNVDALDDILTRLDAERHVLADHTADPRTARRRHPASPDPTTHHGATPADFADRAHQGGYRHRRGQVRGLRRAGRASRLSLPGRPHLPISRPLPPNLGRGV